MNEAWGVLAAVLSSGLGGTSFGGNPLSGECD